MSLASQVSALATRVATEFKNRVGTEADWAGQLNGLLTPPAALAAASKTAAGLVQIGTAAEALAGTDDIKAVTAASLLGASEVRRYATLTAMNTAAGTARDGAIAVLPEIATTNGKVLSSTWRFQSSGAKWIPLTPLKCLNAATLADIKGWPVTYTGLGFDPRWTIATVIRDGVNPNKGWDDYIWIGPTTGFFQWSGPLAGGTWRSGAFDNAGDGSFFYARGELVDVALQGKSAANTPITQYSPVATFPTQGAPKTMIGALAGGYFANPWVTANFYVDSGNSVISLLTGTIPANSDFALSGMYRRQVPTA